MGHWNTDAQFAGVLNEIHLYQNPDIRDFLSRTNFKKFIIVSSKGMGKTLLMRHKREQLQNSPDGFLLIPHDEQSDYVNLPSSPSKTVYASLKDVNFWEDLWKTSLMVSMILHQKHSLDEIEKIDLLDQLDLCGLPSEIEELLIANTQSGHAFHKRPSTILDILLREGKRPFETFRKKGINRLFEIFLDVVKSGCAVFVDSLDQELNKRFPNNLDIWCNGQIGLLVASWELSRHNRHAKIFVTIRQEAFASFKSPEKLNIQGSILLIKYSKKDLRKIFEISIQAYEGAYTVEEFIGFKKIYNGYIRIWEDIFDYIERHTIGVPRWLMILGQDIANIRAGRGVIQEKKLVKAHQKAIADTVNEVSGNTLAKSYLDGELRLFFNGHEPIDVLRQLLKHVQSTVLSMANLVRLNDRYQSDAKESNSTSILCSHECRASRTYGN